MRAATVTWIAIALFLPNLPAGGQEIEVVITKDVARVDDEKADGTGFNAYAHPYGETYVLQPERKITGRLSIGLRTRELLPIGHVFKDCITLCTNKDAGYQLKIFSKHQDPTKGDLFDKPILVTQAFDPSYHTDRQFYYPEFERRLTDVFDENQPADPATGHPNTNARLSDAGLLRELYNEGYDIALLMWKNPLISIQENARVTLQALLWLQDHTAQRIGTEPVIIGPSMGGLVTRYMLQALGALAPSAIRARLFIAFDSPNRGAEIPMSIQALLLHIRNFDAKSHQTFLNLTSVAARQLLLSSLRDETPQRIPVGPGAGLLPPDLGGFLGQEIFDYESASDPENPVGFWHADFMADINRPTFRRQIYNIVHRTLDGREEPIHTAAIINGSGVGLDLGYSLGCRYANENSFFAPHLVLSMTDPGRLQTVLEAGLVRSPLNFYYLYEPAFVENAPGGLRDTYQRTRDSISDDGILDMLQKMLGPFLDINSCFTNARYSGNHAFVPSISGVGMLRTGLRNSVELDIRDNSAWYTDLRTIGTTAADGSVQGTCQPLFNTSATELCMFDEFRAPLMNQNHVQVTRQNKQWFLELIRNYGPRDLGPVGGGSNT